MSLQNPTKCTAQAMRRTMRNAAMTKEAAMSYHTCHTDMFMNIVCEHISTSQHVVRQKSAHTCQGYPAMPGQRCILLKGCHRAAWISHQYANYVFILQKSLGVYHDIASMQSPSSPLGTSTINQLPRYCVCCTSQSFNVHNQSSCPIDSDTGTCIQSAATIMYDSCWCLRHCCWLRQVICQVAKCMRLCPFCLQHPCHLAYMAQFCLSPWAQTQDQ